MDSLNQHYKTNFLLAYPVMLSQFGQISVSVADSVMVGQIGAVPLAAASLANAVFLLLFTFGIGVSYGITPLVAAADGQKNATAIGETLKHGLVINLITGFVILFGIYAGSPLLHYAGQDPEVVKEALPYLKVLGWSIVPFMLFQTFRQYTEGLGKTFQTMLVTLISNLLNIALNYLLIFGKFGFPEMGLYGAGIATLLSRIFMAIAMGWFVFTYRPFVGLLPKSLFKQYHVVRFKKLLNLGIPAGLQFAFEISAFGGAAIMMGWIGVVEQAAHQIAMNLAAISYMMASGLSAAASIRIGNQLGKKDIPNLRRAGFTLYVMVLLFMGMCALYFIVYKDFLPMLYIQELPVIEKASTLLVLAAIFQLSDGAQVLGLGALRGMADVKIPTIMTFIAYWLLGLPIAYYFGFTLDYGAEGIWIGLIVGLTVVAISLYLRFVFLSKKLLLKSKQNYIQD